MFLFSSWTFHSFHFTKNIVFVNCIVIQINFVTLIVIAFTHELLLPINIVLFIRLYQKYNGTLTNSLSHISLTHFDFRDRKFRRIIVFFFLENFDS